jgi:sulfoxide reductase heme-binding subunit YedZ
LAATSFNAAIRRLGARRWRELHRTIYAIGIIAIVHFWWMVKIDTREPLIYGLVLAALLGIRIWWREQERRRQEAGAYGRNMAARVITITPRR